MKSSENKRTVKTVIRTVVLAVLCLVAIALPIVLVDSSSAFSASAAVTELQRAPELEYTTINPPSNGAYLSGTHTEGNVKYNMGGTSDWGGIDFGGFTIKGGNVLFEMESYIPMCGPIVVDGGNILIRIKESAFNASGKFNNSSTGNAIFKRHYNSALLTTSTNGTAGDPGYIPVNASLTENGVTTYQYSGALFAVRSGTVEIIGGCYNADTGEYTYLDENKYAFISGTGQCSMDASNTVDGNFAFPRRSDTQDDIQADGPIFYINDRGNAEKPANVILDRISLRHNFNVYHTVNDVAYNANLVEYTTKDGKTATYGKKASNYDSYTYTGGAVYLTGPAPNLTMFKSEITECYSKSSSGAIHFNAKGGEVVLTETKVTKNYTESVGASAGGTMRAMGSSKSNFTVTNCIFDRNWSAAAAGAIQWNGMESTRALTIIGSTFTNNTSLSGAGAITCGARMDVTSTVFEGNKSVSGNGGAINFTTWNSSENNSTFKLAYNSNLTLGDGVIIRNNSAGGNGGAIYFYSYLIAVGTKAGGDRREFHYQGYYDENNNFVKTDDFSMSLYILEGALIENNTASARGGAIYIRRNNTAPEYTASVFMEGGTLQNNNAGTYGGACYLEGASNSPTNFEMKGGTISGNSCPTYGGGVMVNGGGNFVMKNGTITSNETTDSAGCGGGVSVHSGNFEMSGGTISKNTADHRGAGVEVDGGKFVMSGGIIGGETEEGGNVVNTEIGGGVCVLGTGADFKMTGGKIKYNKATKSSGGGVYVSGGDFKMYKGEDGTGTGGEISYNSGTRGGGVYVLNGDYVMEAGKVSYNTSTTSYGGGIWLLNGKFEMSGGEISYNKALDATYGFGGGVYVEGTGAEFEMSAGDIENNTAKESGGGVFVMKGNFTMSGGTVDSNSTDKNAGGVYVQQGSFTMSGKDSKITNNHADNDNGGGVYVFQGNFTMNAGELSGNSTKYGGGAVYLKNGTFSMKSGTISDNTSTGGYGGAVYVIADGRASNFQMTGGTITLNKSTVGCGGAVYVNAGSFTMSGADSLIYKNTAKLDGGAVYVENGNFTMTGGSVSENESTGGKGGAVYVLGNGLKGNDALGSFTMSGASSILSFNKARNQGGAVYVDQGSFTMSDGKLDQNESKKSEGGAVYLQKGHFVMNSGTISDNVSDGYGGAIFINGVEGGDGTNASFTMHSGTISGNRAVSKDTGGARGGAISIFKDGQFTMHGGKITGNWTSAPLNTEGAHAGAVYVSGDGSSFTMHNGEISNNTAGRDDDNAHIDVGGGVYLSKGDFTMHDGKICNNTANGRGGGVNVYAGDFTMNGGEIYGNEAKRISGTYENLSFDGGAVYIDASGGKGNFTMKGGSIYENESQGSGGAVYVRNGSFTITVANGKKCEIKDNTAQASAGAVFVAQGNFTMTGTEETAIISGNQAKDHGGAVRVDGNGIQQDPTKQKGVFTMNGGLISDNSATTAITVDGTGSKGGAVFVNRGIFTMNGGEISGNSAKREGGAVFVAQGNFVLVDGKLLNNTIDSTLAGGAVYVYNGSFTMTKGEIIGNNAPNGFAGAVCVDGGNFTINGGTVSRNFSKLSGGAIAVIGSGNFYMNENDENFPTVISYNYTDGYKSGLQIYEHLGGGAVYVNGGNFEMTGGKIEYNGMKFNVSADGKTVTPTDEVITQNGGAVYVNEGAFEMSSGEISNNKALGQGGAVHVKGNGTNGSFEMTGGTISNNHAVSLGGAVLVRNGSFTMGGSSLISGNSTDESGGAIHLASGTFTMNGGTIENNSAPKHSGGAVHMQTGTFTMNGGTLNANSAYANGGAVNMSGGTFEMKGGSITANHACWGGGVLLAGGTFTMTDGTVSGNYNTACTGGGNEKRGGGVYVRLANGQGKFEMSGGIIENNGFKDGVAVTVEGGAVYVEKGDFSMSDTKDDGIESIIRGNVVTNNGGAVYVDTGDFEMTGGTITANGYFSAENVVTQYGGAVYVASGNFTMSGGTISDNKTRRAGGAVYLIGNGVQQNIEDQLGIFAMSGGEISGNVATGDVGGAVCVIDGLFTMSGGTIKKNSSPNTSGGAIALTRSSFNMSAGLITENFCKNNGGAVCVGNSDFTMSGGTISYNTGLVGGAVFVLGDGEKGIFRMTGGTISNNGRQTTVLEDGTVEYGELRTKYGGAVYVQLGNFYMSEETGESFITNNGVTISGGGVIIAGGNFYMSAGTLSGNYSKSNGGAVMVTTQTVDEETVYGSFYMTGGTISGNGKDGATLMTERGGGVYVYYGNFTMSAGTISGNVTYRNGDEGGNGGGVYVYYGNFDVSGTAVITGNHAATNGGGIRVNGGGTVTVNGGTISGNTAAGVGGGVSIYGANASFTINNGEISGNSAGTNGGGVHLDGANSKFIVNGGAISDNYCNGKGGGVYVDVGGTFTMTAGSLSGNGKYDEAAVTQVGGAVYVNGSAESKGSFDMSGGTISGNAVTTNGGGVYVYYGNFNMSGTAEMSGNCAATHGGGVYVESGNFTMSAGEISGNTTLTEHGGGVAVVRGDFTMSGTALITNNRANNKGGGIRVYDGICTIKGGTVSENTSYSFGGGISVEYGRLIMNDGIISGNKTEKDSGAGVAVEQEGAYFEMNGGKIINNVSAASAGAIRISDGTVVINAGEIKGNSCKDSGGVVYMTSGTCYINGGTLEGNESNSGGALRVNGGTCYIAGGLITGNTSRGSGGGVYVSDNKTVEGNVIMTGGEVIGNNANGSGGGIYISNGSFSMTAGLISGNKALDGSGGGVAVSSGSAIIYGGTIQNNTASIYGGGLFVGTGTLQLSADVAPIEEGAIAGGVISGNTATRNGGGIYVNEGTVIMLTGSILSNTANESGGGIYIDNGDFNMGGGKISGNTATTISGGGVYVNSGSFIMTSGEVSKNTAALSGGGVYVGSGGSATIGFEGCYGNPNGTTHTSCPVFFENTARDGGALCLFESTSVFHCGEIYENVAANNGGAVHVTNANITLNYALIARNEAENYGGGIYVEATGSHNIAVTVDSGIIRANTAKYGGGVSVRALDSSAANVTIGRNGCTAANTTHKHPDITANVALLEGGGIWIFTENQNGVIFTIYCGELQGNVANKNIPTSNILQEGGQLVISGTYQIDNATVVNGSFTRPDISKETVTVIYHYGTGGDKTTTITAGKGMIINLPSALPEYDEETKKTRILVRWEIRGENSSTAYECGFAFSLDPSHTGDVSTIDFYAVWIVQGDGFGENPVVTPGAVYHHSTGTSTALVELNNLVTMQFAVSECNPSTFIERFITFNNTLPKGTTIIMVDVTTAGVNAYYYYNVVGDELTVSLGDFAKMGDPTVSWSNTVINANNNSTEEFLFIFDFTRTESAYKGALQVTMTRTYADQSQGEVAPMVQVASCAIIENDMPTIEFTEPPYEVDDEFSITYVPGIAVSEESNLYNMQASVVIFAKNGVIPAESYVMANGETYITNERGIIIVPIGAAKEGRTLKLQFVSAGLMTSGEGIDLGFRLYMTPDAEKPLMTQSVFTQYIALDPKPLPSADFKLTESGAEGGENESGERIFYLEELPGFVSISLEGENLDSEQFELQWQCKTLEKHNDGSSEYVDTNLISVSKNQSGGYELRFVGNVVEGTYRIILVVSDRSNDGIVYLNVPYNFVVMSK